MVSRTEPTAFDDINVSSDYHVVPWVPDDFFVDQVVDAYEQWFEPFGGSQSGRLRWVPPVGVPYAPHGLEFDGALIASVEDESLAPVLVGESYVLRGRIAEKFVRRGRGWVWVESILTDSSGSDVHRHRYLVAFPRPRDSGITSEQPRTRDFSHMDRRELDMHPYEPSPVIRRSPESYQSVRQASRLNGYVTPSMPLGADLIAESVLFSWRKSRDEAEIYWVRLNGETPQYAAYHFHTHDQAAHDVGLDGANVSGIQLQARLHALMTRATGEFWLRSGSLECRFLASVQLDSVVTAKGRLVRSELTESGVRMSFDTHVEDESGTKVLVGTCSVTLPHDQGERGVW